jgi:PmbA protein
MNNNEKYALADMVIAHALKNGAQQVSVSIDENRSNNIEIRDQKIDSLKESNRSGMNIDLYVDNKYSSSSTNRLKKDDLLKFTGEAIAATRYLAEDQFRKLPEPELYYKGGGADLGLYDKKLESIDAKTKIDLANQVMNEAFGKDERIISVSSYYSDSLNNRLMVTSNGFRGDSQRSNLSLVASVSMKSDIGRPSDYWYESSVFFDKLIKNDIGKKALERTIRKLGPKKIASGKYTMILENRIAPNLLNPVYSSLQGGAIYRKESFLIGKKDKQVASKLMTIWDDPTIPGGSGSRLFDAEGLASAKRIIFEDGMLRDFYIDTYYGRKLEMKPTSGDASNIVFKLGDRDMNAMVGGLKKGILVTGFIGGNFNGSTGDFSYGIEGFLVENGKLVQPVNEMNISGNMNDIWMRLVEVGNDIIEGSSQKIPSLMLDAIDFSGI